MAGFRQTPKFILRLIRIPPQVAYAIGLGPLIGRLILLLITTGRKTGKKRVTPLQYEQIDGVIYVGAALGKKADWLRNLQANPQVEVHLKSQRFRARAEVISDVGRIADFLEVRLQRHPRMLAAMLRVEGFHIPPGRRDLERYAQGLAVVALRPE
jgi:deazaflavin-dependent oxidoreductase (nitroreductase family)